MSTGGATTGALVAAAVAQAIKASGTIVKLKPDEFFKIIQKMENPLIVMAEGGVFKKNYQYLTSYRGLAFYTKTNDPISLPSKLELITAKKILIPSQ